MSEWTLISLLLAVVLALVMIFVDDAFERSAGWVCTALGISSGNGPLEPFAARDEEGLVRLVVLNRGRQNMRLAAIQVRAETRSLPTPYPDRESARAGANPDLAAQRFAETKLDAGGSCAIYLREADLPGGLENLGVLDELGRSWSVTVAS